MIKPSRTDLGTRNTNDCVATGAGRAGSLLTSPDASRASSRTGAGDCALTAGRWEPDEPRGSRPGVRGRAEETGRLKGQHRRRFGSAATDCSFGGRARQRRQVHDGARHAPAVSPERRPSKHRSRLERTGPDGSPVHGTGDRSATVGTRCSRSSTWPLAAQSGHAPGVTASGVKQQSSESRSTPAFRRDRASCGSPASWSRRVRHPRGPRPAPRGRRAHER